MEGIISTAIPYEILVLLVGAALIPVLVWRFHKMDETVQPWIGRRLRQRVPGDALTIGGIRA